MNWPLLLKVVQLAGNRAWLLVCWTQDSVLNPSTQRDCGVRSPAFLFLLLLFRASDLSLAVSEYSRWPESVLWRSFPSWGSKYCHSFLYGKGAPFQFGFFCDMTDGQLSLEVTINYSQHLSLTNVVEGQDAGSYPSHFLWGGPTFSYVNYDSC